MSLYRTYTKGKKKTKQKKNKQKKNKQTVLSIKKKQHKTKRVLAKKRRHRTLKNLKLKGGIASIGLDVGIPALIALTVLGSVLLWRRKKQPSLDQPSIDENAEAIAASPTHSPSTPHPIYSPAVHVHSQLSQPSNEYFWGEDVKYGPAEWIRIPGGVKQGTIVVVEDNDGNQTRIVAPLDILPNGLLPVQGLGKGATLKELNPHTKEEAERWEATVAALKGLNPHTKEEAELWAAAASPEVTNFKRALTASRKAAEKTGNGHEELQDMLDRFRAQLEPPPGNTSVASASRGSPSRSGSRRAARASSH